jgi:hypothetical protein
MGNCSTSTSRAFAGDTKPHAIIFNAEALETTGQDLV